MHKQLCGTLFPRILVVIWLFVMVSGCSAQPEMFSSGGETWGIYRLDLATGNAFLLYGVETELSGLSLNSAGDNLVFSQMTGGSGYEFSEIYSLSLTGGTLSRLTENASWDLYPVWSPDGTRIAFLSWRDATLDIYLMDADGSNQTLLYDSGFHDADIDWVGKNIVFTSQSRIWMIDEEGSNARQLTDPPRAGEWGGANLPFGDYDPRLSPDGTKLIFSRLFGDGSVHGNYELIMIDFSSADSINLTNTRYSQGLSSWSPNGDKILFIISAVGGEGVYDLYSMKVDGSDKKMITPASFPPQFLIHWARYSLDESQVYFIGQWWQEPNP